MNERPIGKIKIVNKGKFCNKINSKIKITKNPNVQKFD
jgi:hypothetical protein